GPRGRALDDHLRPALAEDLGLLEAAVAIRDVDLSLHGADDDALGHGPDRATEPEPHHDKAPPTIASREPRRELEADDHEGHEADREQEIAREEDRPDVVLVGDLRKDPVDEVGRGRDVGW